MPDVTSSVTNASPSTLLYYFLEISPASFLQIKEDQFLRVNFDQFAQRLVDLLNRTMSGELKLVLSKECVLQFLETTPFRELNHLQLILKLGSNDEVRLYVGERLVQEMKNCELLKSKNAATASELDHLRNENEKHKQEAYAMKRAIDAERNEMNEKYERRRQESLREARLEIAEDERNRRDRAEAKVLELETKLALVEEERRKERTELEILRAETQKSDGPTLRIEVNELRLRFREMESRALEETSKAARFEQSIVGLQKELALREETVGKLNEALRVEKANLEKMEEKCNSLSGKYEPLLSREQQARDEVDRVRNELNAYKAKSTLKNTVIKEQEKVILEMTANLNKLEQHKAESDKQLSLQNIKIAELTNRVEESKAKLQECAKTLESNANVISYLNRELNGATRFPFSSYSFAATAAATGKVASSNSGGDGGLLSGALNQA